MQNNSAVLRFITNKENIAIGIAITVGLFPHQFEAVGIAISHVCSTVWDESLAEVKRNWVTYIGLGGFGIFLAKWRKYF